MKHFYLFAGLFIFTAAISQTPEMARIVEAERKSGASTMNAVINPNTANYDVTYHKLEFTVNPSTVNPFISGKVTTTFTALANMSTITFDMVNNLNVSSVKQGATNLAFAESGNDELVITLPATLASGASATVEINYSGTPPADQGSFVRDTHNGAPIISTLSEPFGAKDWWPCKQDLTDKINSIDVYITAPSQFVSVSNGLQMGTTTSGSNKTTHFHHGYPIPAYLVAIAVSNYSIFTLEAGTEPNTFPIVNYVYPENLASAQGDIAETLPIMDLFEQLFETYPFSNEKYGHCQFEVGGGMEHTTVSFMGNFSRGLIAHELGHQWFGDKITCGTWKDIWLNEGFATYLAALVIENFDGVGEFIMWKGSAVNYITSQPGGAVYLTDSEAENSNRIFSSRLSYNKGAMVLEMLRWKLGDANFFQGIKNYLADPDLAYNYAVTTDLKAHLEAASGMDLTEFFNDWIYNQGYPTYDITSDNNGLGQVVITINQTQSHSSVGFFEMPVPVRVYGSAGQQMDLVLNNTFDGQTFTENVPFIVTEVDFDPDVHLISRDSFVTLGKDNFSLNASVKLYPNPAANTLSVSLPADASLKSATFHNILGQVVLQSESETSWDISKLSTGVHFVTLVTSSGTKTLKFIKK